MSQSLRDQLRNADLKVENDRAPRNSSKFDDFLEVLDIRTNHDVVYLGGNSWFAQVRERARTVTTIRNRNELRKVLASGASFGRVLMTRENVLDEDALDAAAQLTGDHGLVCFFSEDAGLRDGFEAMVELLYPTAQVWRFETNVGPCVVTDAHGPSTRTRN